MRKQRGLTLFVGLVFAFLFLPLVLIAITSFGENATIQFPIEGFTFKWYQNIFVSEAFVDGFLLSLEIGLLATVLALIIGVPAKIRFSETWD